MALKLTGTSGGGGLRSAVASGNWSSPTVFGPVSTNALTLNDLLLVPFLPRAGCAIDQLGVDVTTLGVGATIRLGIYDSDDVARPLNLLADAGTVDAGSTGWKKSTAFAAVNLSSGRLYWLAVAAQGAVSTIRSVNSFSPLVLSGDAALTGQTGYKNTGVSGALPATLTTWAVGTIAPFVRAHSA